MTIEIKKKIKKITKIIQKANFDYFQLNQSKITDEQYDNLLKELIILEQKYPEYKLSNSPTSKVGGFLSHKFKKVKHDIPMLSLGNVFDFQELKKFYDRIIKKHNNVTFITELKIDGIAISLKYKKGILYQAITRGNGYYGELITNNVKNIKDIPLKIKEEIDLEVRGEIFFHFNDFEKLNQEQKEKKNFLFSNPRNAASGTLRQLNPNIASKRNLSSFIYSIINPPSFIKKQKNILIFLEKIGFSVNKYYKLVNSFEELLEKINYYEKIKKNLPYNNDGIVVKVNELNLYDNIGYTSKFPKWAIAYKFKTAESETIITKINFQIGRTGVITPIAFLIPTIVDGSVISKVSLHNYNYIKKKDIRINDFVLIHKSGSIIPEIIKIIKEKRTNQVPFKMISYCPFCNSKLQKKEIEEIELFCLNENCEEKQIKELTHFVSKEAMNINILGNKTLAILFKQKMIKKKSDIYNLQNKKNELEKLPFFGKKKVNNILNAIEESKQRPLENVLFSLGIRHVGIKIAKILIKKFKNITNLTKASYKSILKINEIGDKISKSIFNFFQNEKNIKELNLLKQKGINFSLNEENKLIQNKKKEKNILFKNKKIVLTGILNNFKREKIKKILEEYEAIITNNVSKKTNFLICGKKSSENKIKKANNLKIKIINEQDLIKILFYKNNL
ncbi:DNA ligase, NAD-dependent [Candidatus Phytoplasma oryzae]|uniref:DNA ligase n=1 Tax=Candidatus Phytoplasma oryzae TaxID=203274 RepID=A0A139JR98_9MOLU|nr:NAD-dependent DNA ligase LigA [Candidatus Phytoplasma oryzae]KXT29364.1 DNA ligase, NAD-dependent [Candidatus Phytoplasma oryzae]RAM57949.1 DNA ligase [Candidatus Phytoplasma oryzae]